MPIDLWSCPMTEDEFNLLNSICLDYFGKRRERIDSYAPPNSSEDDSEAYIFAFRCSENLNNSVLNSWLNTVVFEDGNVSAEIDWSESPVADSDVLLEDAYRIDSIVYSLSIPFRKEMSKELKRICQERTDNFTHHNKLYELAEYIRKNRTINNKGD